MSIVPQEISLGDLLFESISRGAKRKLTALKGALN